MPYTLFKEEVGKRNVKAIYSQGETITGRFAAPVTYPPTASRVPRPAASPKQRASAVEIRAAPAQDRDVTSRLRCPPSSTPVWKHF